MGPLRGGQLSVSEADELAPAEIRRLSANFLAFGFASFGISRPSAVIGFLKFVMRFGHFSCFYFEKLCSGPKSLIGQFPMA